MLAYSYTSLTEEKMRKRILVILLSHILSFTSLGFFRAVAQGGRGIGHIKHTAEEEY